MSLTLKTKSFRAMMEDVGEIYKHMSEQEKAWYYLFLRAVESQRKDALKAILPDENMFDKIWVAVNYESHHKNRIQESQATDRHSSYRLHDYNGGFGGNEDAMIAYIDNKYADETVRYMNGRWGSDRVRDLVEYEENAEYLTKSYKRQQTVTAPQNHSTAEELYTYVKALLERNAGIIARGEALWQKPVDEIKALMNTNTTEESADEHA